MVDLSTSIPQLDSTETTSNILTSLQNFFAFYAKMNAKSTERVDLFSIGTDSNVIHKSFNGSQWKPSDKEWDNLGGQSMYEPTYISRKNDLINVFILNFKRELLHKTFDGQRWQDWENLGGTWAERPSVISSNPDRLEVFVVGQNGRLYCKRLEGRSFSKQFEDLGGQFIAPIAAVSRDKDRIDLFGTTPDRKIHRKYYDGKNWGPKGASGEWENMGGNCYDMPRAVSIDNKRIDLFCVGDDSALYSRTFDGNKWNSNWENLGGIIHMLPEVVCMEEGRLDVFVIGTDHAVYHKYLEDNKWKPSQKDYEFMSGTTTDRLTALTAKNRIDLLHVGVDSQCYVKSYDGDKNHWTPGLTGYKNLGGTCMSPIASAD
jgi:hypothetical protein